MDNKCLNKRKMPSPRSGSLSPLQVGQYHRDGYLLLPAFFSQDTVHSLLASVTDLEKNVRRVQSPFKSQTKGSGKNLIDSAHQVVGFGAGNKCPIQQIGHNLHGEVPEFKKVSYSDDVWNLCKALDVENPQIVQSKVVMKPPRHGWRVPVHSDEQFIYTNPVSGFGLWWALDPCTTSNGCLEVIPGSHLRYSMAQRFKCDHKEAMTGFVKLEQGVAGGDASKTESKKTLWTKKEDKKWKGNWTVSMDKD